MISSVEAPHRKPTPFDPVAKLENAASEDEVMPFRREWSLANLRDLEWRRLEELVAAIVDTKPGFRSKLSDPGPDGGIDVRAYREGEDPERPVMAFQCKAWRKRLVGVRNVREFLGVMSREGIPHGVFITSGDFDPQVRKEMGKVDNLELMNGLELLQLLRQAPEEGGVNETLLTVAFATGYNIPTCVECAGKMIMASEAERRRNDKRYVCAGCGTRL